MSEKLNLVRTALPRGVAAGDSGEPVFKTSSTAGYAPPPVEPFTFETQIQESNRIEPPPFPEDGVQDEKDKVPFTLKAGKDGAEVLYGCLIEKVDRLHFSKNSAFNVNEFTGQDAVKSLTAHVPDGMSSSEPYEFLKLGYFGDVYLVWEFDQECNIKKVYLSESSSTPSVVDYPKLGSDLKREFSSGAVYGGYIKIGNVTKGEPIEQVVAGDVYVTTTHVPDGSSSSGSGSSSSSSSGSGSGSGSSSSDPGSTGPSSSSDPGSTGPSSGSDKSTAIVPVPWSPTGYAALFILEAPEVRFDDVVTLRVTQRKSSHLIDPRYVLVCEPGSIRVCGWSSDSLLSGLAIRVEGGKLHLEADAPWYRRGALPCTVTLRLTGIRKGFAGKRFPARTREQFEANEAFINSAYPASKDP